MVLPTGTTDAFTYNGDGQRVQKVDSTGTMNFLWDGQNVLLETNASNVIQAMYTLEPRTYGNLISQRRGGATAYYHFDGLGSSVQLTDATVSVTDNYLYDSWGNILATLGSTVNYFRYAGRIGYYLLADLPMYSLRARNYLQISGRFISPDPAMSANPWYYGANWNNPYTYAANNPVRYVDPSGLLVPAVLAGLAVAVAACAYPFHEYAHNHYPNSGDKFKHCWVSCQMSRACTGILTQFAGLGKEALDILKGLLRQEQYPGFADSLDDLIANQQCVHFESYIPVLNFCGYLRESCYDCCSREVGYNTQKL